MSIDEAIESMGYGHVLQLLADLGYDTDRYIDGGAREALASWAVDCMRARHSTADSVIDTLRMYGARVPA